MSDPCGGNETPPWSAPGPRPPPHGAGAVGLESRDTGRALPKARRHAPLDHGETAERGVLGHCPCQRHAAHSHPGGQPLHPEAVRRSRCSRAAQNSRGVDEARADDAGGRRRRRRRAEPTRPRPPGDPRTVHCAGRATFFSSAARAPSGGAAACYSKRANESRHPGSWTARSCARGALRRLAVSGFV